MVRKPAPVLKPSDWEKSSNGRQWKPQLGFNRDRRPVHLDPAAFRALGWVVGFSLCVFWLFRIFHGALSQHLHHRCSEIIKYNYSAAILMTLILFCFSSFLKFSSVSLVYLLLCVAWEFHYFLSRDFAVSDRYFRRMKHAVYPQESCDWVNLWVSQSLYEELPAPGLMPVCWGLRDTWMCLLAC